MTADEMARTWHAWFTDTVDAKQPPWEGVAVDLRRDRVATWQAMLDAGWRFVPPKEFTPPKETA